MTEIERIAKETLSQIIDYVGADEKYKEYAQLLSYIENAIKRGR